MVLANSTVIELQYILTVDLEPYAKYIVIVILKPGEGEESSANFTTPEGGLCMHCDIDISRVCVLITV